MSKSLGLVVFREIYINVTQLPLVDMHILILWLNINKISKKNGYVYNILKAKCVETELEPPIHKVLGGQRRKGSSCEISNML